MAAPQDTGPLPSLFVLGLFFPRAGLLSEPSGSPPSSGRAPPDQVLSQVLFTDAMWGGSAYRQGWQQTGVRPDVDQTDLRPSWNRSVPCLSFLRINLSESIFFIRKLFENNLPRRQGETRRTPGVGGCSIVYRRMIGGAES
jgi:hypothetical protein